MTFVLNYNVSPKLGEALEESGHTARRALTKEADKDILAAAAADGSIIVTCDADFGALIHRDGWPHAGIVLLRLKRNTADHQITAVIGAIRDGRVRSGAFLVLTDADARKVK